MIINNRKDLDAAPQADRDRFMARLAGTINKYQWDGADWVLEQDTTSIARFGFSVSDFPDAPVPDKPTHDPDQKALEAEKQEIRDQRDALLKATDWTQVADAPVNQQAYKDYRAALRDVPQQTGFPDNVTWPIHPG